MKCSLFVLTLGGVQITPGILEHLGIVAEIAARTAAEPATGNPAETCSRDFTAESGRVPAAVTAAEDVIEAVNSAAEAVALGAALQLRLQLRLL